MELVCSCELEDFLMLGEGHPWESTEQAENPVAFGQVAAREFSDFILLVRTPEQFVRALEDVLSRGENGTVAAEAAARRQAVSGFSWDARFQRVEEVLRAALVDQRPR